MSRNPLLISQVRSLTFLRNSISDLVESLAKVTSLKSRVMEKSQKLRSTKTHEYFRSEKCVSNSNVNTPETNLNLKSEKNLVTICQEQEDPFEKAVCEWIDIRMSEKSPEAKPLQLVPVITSCSTVEGKSRKLLHKLATASSPASQLLRLQDVCNHLMKYPETKGAMVRERAINIVLCLRERSMDSNVQSQSHKALALLGYCDPPRGSGIRILSIDGGGTRGMVGIELLRHLERATGCKVSQMFDYICGVSTGAILAMLLGGLQSTLDECEELYRKLSREIFNRSSLIGTGHLLWSHAYYDTSAWETLLRKSLGDDFFIETATKRSTPKLAAVSAIVNKPTLQAFVFRNYALPYRSQSQYPGGNYQKMWEAVRASAAAPGYFEEFCLDSDVHQDGGLLLNNPTALAIHEAKLLWPQEEVSCVVSLGNGRYIPPTEKPSACTTTSLKTKMIKIVDSATDTEGVHWIVNDLLPPSVYFRLNPYLTEPVTLDENRPEKLEQLKLDAQMYVRRNEHKIRHAAKRVMQKRSRWQSLRDWIRLQSNLRQ